MKSIIFNTEMVRALTDGRKTVTRRAIKPQPEGKPVPMTKSGCWPGYFSIQGTDKVVRLPFLPGDVLWVRETWAEMPYGFVYRAEDEEPDGWEPDDRWRPSIHMPREAARIFLRVKDVRAERLQEITEDGAKAEGAVKSYPYTDPETGKTAFMLDEKGTYRSGFSQIWDSTVPKHPSKFKRHPYYWTDNPWVWVIEFERTGEV